jgi:hypothetical protein
MEMERIPESNIGGPSKMSGFKLLKSPAVEKVWADRDTILL